MTIEELAGLLHETADQHGAFEAVAPPHDWWDWYAAYLGARQRGASPADAAVAADRYMAEVKDVVPLSGPRFGAISDRDFVTRYGDPFG